MRIWAQNAFLGTKMRPGKRGSRWPRSFPHRCSEIRRVENAIFVKNPENNFRILRCRIYFPRNFIFPEIPRKNHTFCVLRQTVEKQRRNGAILDQNPQKCTFGSKNAFWTQKRILGPKCVFGPKSDSWGAKCDFEQKITFELSRTHIPSAEMKKRRGRSQKCEFWPKIAFIQPNWVFSLFLRLWAQKGVFCEKVHFCAPMPRMLIKPMEN